MQTCTKGFRANHSETTVVFGNNILATNGIQELTTEKYRRILVVPTNNALDKQEIGHFLGLLEKKIAFVFYHWNPEDLEYPAQELAGKIEELQVDTLLAIGDATACYLAKRAVLLGATRSERPVKIINIPTTLSSLEMTDMIISRSETVTQPEIHNPLIKPSLIIYDKILFSSDKEIMIRTAFILLAHICGIVTDENISPLSILAATECVRICMRVLRSFLKGKEDAPLDDLIRATYLCGEVLNRQPAQVHHFIVNILHAQFRLRYEDTHIAMLPYICWYNQDKVVQCLMDEIGSTNLAGVFFDLQTELIPKCRPLPRENIRPSLPTDFLRFLDGYRGPRPASLQKDKLGTMLDMALSGQRPEGHPKQEFNTNTSCAVVLDRYTTTCCNPRLLEVIISVVQHLHSAVKELDLTVEEWAQATNFLTRVGQQCSHERQEMVMLGDVLGLEALVQDMQFRKNLEVTHCRATPGSLIGPFYMPDAPVLNNGAPLFDKKSSENEMEYVFRGRVLDGDGAPIANAVLDVWHSDDHGFYDLQSEFKHELSAVGFRAKFITDENGAWSFRTLPVQSYHLPQDGPVGELVMALGQHSYLPAHIHFIVVAKGFRPLHTHLYPSPDDPYLQDDAGFAHKPELVKEGTLGSNGREKIFQHDFVIARSDEWSGLDPLHYAPPVAAGQFFTNTNIGIHVA